LRQSGEYRIGAKREVVWRALNDPDVLCACIEGCQSIAKIADDAFKAVVQAKIGPVSASFSADVKLEDVDPPNSYALKINVTGGGAGFGKGVARVALRDDGAGTLLSYDVEGSVGGKLAQVGQRLIDGVARKMADDFFGRFSLAVSEGAPAPPAAPAMAKTPPPAVRWTMIGAAGLIGLALLIALWMLR
jgi:carbon monoxide dehydrogenase subunit G